MRRSLCSWLWRIPIDQEIDEELALHVDLCELTAELERKALETVVCDEQVRAQPEHRDGQALLTREIECALELLDRLRSREGPRRASRTEGREA